MRVGDRLKLPSGRAVQLLALHNSSRGLLWECGYLQGWVLMGPGHGNAARVTLRVDWLLTFGAPL